MIKNLFRITLFICFIVSSSYSGTSQLLKPGFDKEEYIRLMKVSAQFGDSSYASQLIPDNGYTLLYRSPVMGLDNRWDLWSTNKGVPVISIRGTTKAQVGWLANFYAAMIPASGQLQLTKDQTFNYSVASDSKAAVHVGWMVALGFLSKDILPRIDSCYKNGSKEFYILGHSQGGAIAYLLTAYIYNLQKQNLLPADIRLKTYCSAAPKPGNLYFAYEYEKATYGGWAFDVVNPLDWVPQSPFSVQTISDYADANPFRSAKTVIRKQKWPTRVALRHAYGRMTKPSRKAMKNYNKYLGGFVSKAVKKNLPGYSPPSYVPTSDYVRTGDIIILAPDDEYKKTFPQDPSKIWVNHMHQAYIFLTRQLPESK